MPSSSSNNTDDDALLPSDRTIYYDQPAPSTASLESKDLVCNSLQLQLALFLGSRWRVDRGTWAAVVLHDSTTIEFK